MTHGGVTPPLTSAIADAFERRSKEVYRLQARSRWRWTWNREMRELVASIAAEEATRYFDALHASQP